MNHVDSRRRQRGVTLIVSMILLMIMSLLAITSLRGTVMQERMSANTYDSDLAFQAAEAGLRLGERSAEEWAKAGISIPIIPVCPDPNSTGRYINKNPELACPEPWIETIGEPFWHAASTGETLQFADSGLSLAPQYIVELISVKAPCNPSTPAADQTCKRFRITAGSKDANGRARVVLQSIYATE
jgi:type IV pilus assembly protein PilX